MQIAIARSIAARTRPARCATKNRGYRIMEVDVAGPAATRRETHRESARACTVAPDSGRLRISWEGVVQTPDGRMPARIAGGPSGVIREEDGAAWSPGLKHAPQDRRR
ncbi:hypothetical protein [Burkholderia catarinensis]|uniref:hypothetical protein n=1 Tax=Burkholderia catarinensis TaxID=1108140 RepID=UPI00090F8F6D|nr:hypothetical protein [Burkholderia catarinensis]